MGTTTLCVHLRLPHYAIALSPPHEFETLLWILNGYLIESLHIDSVLFVLVNQ
jgi:hypothetical protein